MSVLNFLPFLLTSCIGTISTFDYCSLKCEHQNEILNHIVCERHNDCSLPAYGCINFLNASLTPEERTLILEAHNRLRKTVALGETQFGLRNITASNMNQLVWSDELEYIALCWVNTCEVKPDEGACLDTQRGKSGYNAAFKRISIEVNELDTAEMLTEHIDGWNSEIQGLSYETVESFPDKESYQLKFKHVSQMIWARTVYVGCARSLYGQYITAFVCVYNPGGNIVDESIFKQGPPCSACESGRCTATSEGLCEVLVLDTYPPFNIVRVVPPEIKSSSKSKPRTTTVETKIFKYTTKNANNIISKRNEYVNSTDRISSKMDNTGILSVVSTPIYKPAATLPELTNRKFVVVKDAESNESQLLKNFGFWWSAWFSTLQLFLRLVV